jgi:hypothetical protein
MLDLVGMVLGNLAAKGALDFVDGGATSSMS